MADELHELKDRLAELTAAVDTLLARQRAEEQSREGQSREEPPAPGLLPDGAPAGDPPLTPPP